MSGPPLLLSVLSAFNCLFSSFKGPPGSRAVLLACPFSDHFCTLFWNPLFDNKLYQNCCHWDPQNRPKTQKSHQNLTSKRTRAQDLEKGSASKGSNLQKCQHSHTLSCFCRCPELPKLRQNGVHNGASGHPKSQTTFKNEVSKKNKKRALSKVGF